MITFERVTKQYEDGTKAVSNLDLSIKKGEFFVVIGPSGCGKTTTMKMINRLIDPTDGTIRINDQPITEGDIHKLRWNIGYVLQQIALFPNMTVGENIAVVPEMKKWEKSRIRDRVNELLELVGLDADVYRHRMPTELSGGQQQRVGVARALAADPDILLMDEPFSALDPISREQLQEDIKNLQHSIKKTIVFVTHDMDEALKLGDRICVMKEGKVVQVGTASELMYEATDSFVTDFIGDRALKRAPKRVVRVHEIMRPVSENHQSLGTTERSILFDAPIEEAYQLLEEDPIAPLLVKEANKVVGTISYAELAKAWMKEREA
ncbi:ABC transporter ATP-binding protein [Bacillus sp. FJAT-45037]|uniref:ABC transporter ATP-binding protein n=1 Tax=Bacillus sp. FJAT-45037 TaxID=2011007 RepID=UPI000C237CFC|nr:ABC transporter ATP-binding protein [Bacillus sp. FJAT-45037]